jgi:hypothetical protein
LAGAAGRPDDRGFIAFAGGPGDLKGIRPALAAFVDT